jgi:hypothetical protein
MNMSMTRIAVFSLISGTMLAGLAGCQTSGKGWEDSNILAALKKPIPWSKDRDDVHRQGNPTRMHVNWIDTVLYHQGQKPQRGFGGRLYFYEDGSDKPLLVEGQLVVYAFDETNRDALDHTPTRRYVFPAEQISLRMSESELGPSYNFWLPWDEVGGYQTEVSLICRFEPLAGPVVTSEQTRHLLPGTPRSQNVAANERPKVPEGVPYRPAVEQASYQPWLNGASRGAQTAVYEAAPTPQNENSPRRMASMTIPLPDSFRLGGSASMPQANPTSGPSQQPLIAPQQPYMVPSPGQAMPPYGGAYPTGGAAGMPAVPAASNGTPSAATSSGRLGMIAQQSRAARMQPAAGVSPTTSTMPALPVPVPAIQQAEPGQVQPGVTPQAQVQPPAQQPIDVQPANNATRLQAAAQQQFGPPPQPVNPQVPTGSSPPVSAPGNFPMSGWNSHPLATPRPFPMNPAGVPPAGTASYPAAR